MHCFFKFLEHVNPRINSLTFKKENAKTLTYNFSSVRIVFRDKSSKPKGKTILSRGKRPSKVSSVGQFLLQVPRSHLLTADQTCE